MEAIYRIAWIDGRAEPVSVLVKDHEVVEALRLARRQAAGGVILVQLVSRSTSAAEDRNAAPGEAVVPAAT